MTTTLGGPSRVRTASGFSTGARSSRSVKSAISGTSGHNPGIPLARRLLQPHLPSTPLPPIFINQPEAYINDFPRLNEEIYDIIALALRAYVTPWWSKLAARDKEFVPEISLVIVHILQALEERITTADVPSLLCHDIPTLLVQHYKDYRAAASKLHTSYASDASLPRMFHHMQSHLAVSETGQFNDTYLRQAVDHVLKSCLPQEDWDSEMERSIVREVIVRPILGNVLPKLAEPWFLHTIALSLLGAPRPLEVSLDHDLWFMPITDIQNIATPSTPSPTSPSPLSRCRCYIPHSCSNNIHYLSSSYRVLPTSINSHTYHQRTSNLDGPQSPT